MSRGTKLNNISKNFTSRDSLGIEGVANSISAEICPVVNTVTPRAFYWPFMAWIYYDFYEYSGIKERTTKVFDKYLKRQDYFFVLANLLVDASDRVNMVGITQTEKDMNDYKDTGVYSFNPDYFKSTYGGMQYYNAGCLSLKYITNEDTATNRTFSFPRRTNIGIEMAKAFENVIKDTEYYKNYRLGDSPVPRDVLIEYGQVINIGLVGFDDCKRLLKQRLFYSTDNKKLVESSKYVKYLNDNCSFDVTKKEDWRRILYDHQCIDKDDNLYKVEVPDELQVIKNEWEIVIGRQYFTAGLGLIWKYMLDELYGVPRSRDEWIWHVINRTDWTINIEDNLSSVIELSKTEPFDNKTRESKIHEGTGKYSKASFVEDGLRILLDVYNKFNNRDDYVEEKLYLSYGKESDSIALEELIEVVDRYKDRSIKEFLYYIMDKWLIVQHYTTAFEKLIQGRDGFYYEVVDDIYYHKRNYEVYFRGIRLVQLTQVMKDLDML